MGLKYKIQAYVNPLAYLRCRYVVNGWCHLMTFVRDGSEFLSTWYLVCVLVNCLIANCIPDRSDDWCSRCRHLTVTVALAILALVVFLNISLSATLFYVAGDRPICTTLSEPGTAIYILDHADAFINVLTPLIGNCLFGVLLVLVKQCCIERSPRDSQQHAISHRYVLLHTALWIPYQVAQLYNVFSILSSRGEQSHSSLQGFLVEQTFRYLHGFNMASNFFTLILPNALFRKKLREGVVGAAHRITCCSCCCCLDRSDTLNTQDHEYQYANGVIELEDTPL